MQVVLRKDSCSTSPSVFINWVIMHVTDAHFLDMAGLIICLPSLAIMPHVYTGNPFMDRRLLGWYV